MKILKYQLADISIVETENETREEITLRPHERYSDEANFEKNYAIAQAEAYNGEVTVEDTPDPVTDPTPEEDTASMLVDHEYRLTLLELGLTEA